MEACVIGSISYSLSKINFTFSLDGIFNFVNKLVWSNCKNNVKSLPWNRKEKYFKIKTYGKKQWITDKRRNTVSSKLKM